MATTTKELLAELNSLREAAGMKTLSAWKESRAKLEAAIQKLKDDAAQPEPKKEPAEKPKAKEKSTDTFTLAQVAAELGKNPKVLRARFRRLFPDHDGPWEFDNSRRDEILKAAKGQK